MSATRYLFSLVVMVVAAVGIVAFLNENVPEFQGITGVVFAVALSVGCLYISHRLRRAYEKGKRPR